MNILCSWRSAGETARLELFRRGMSGGSSVRRADLERKT